MTQNAMYFRDVVSYEGIGSSQYDSEVVFWNNHTTGIPLIVPENGIPTYSPSLQGSFLRSKIPLSGIDFNAPTPDFVLALPNYQNLDNSVSRSAFDSIDTPRDDYLHHHDGSIGNCQTYCASDKFDRDGGYTHVYYPRSGYTTECADANRAEVPGSLSPGYKLPEIISGFEEHEFHISSDNPPIKPGEHFSENVDATPGIAAHHSPHNATKLFHPAASADTFHENQAPSAEDTIGDPMWSLQAISDPKDWQRYNIRPLRFPRHNSINVA
ncbi:hypothetical protein SCHPADRAFT_942825 [Schizopora paradoxa]|uniref:Uncharacterized protein n=1 Tax=Schizopora paradoxa TaxID=27342 RepID=A0A0H2RF25_9AGAM|nr:hypothetical protein SCHPADRAFT_942825 [Schizopora paradoxa]